MSNDQAVAWGHEAASHRIPRQGQPVGERTSSARSHANQYEVFAKAVDAGDVWISGLGVGANSADVLVNSPDWRGGPELARQLFYQGLGTGRYGILRANVVPGWRARSTR